MVRWLALKEADEKTAHADQHHVMEMKRYQVGPCGRRQESCRCGPAQCDGKEEIAGRRSGAVRLCLAFRSCACLACRNSLYEAKTDDVLEEDIVCLPMPVMICIFQGDPLEQRIIFHGDPHENTHAFCIGIP